MSLCPLALRVPHREGALRDVMALLAYEDPADSPLSHLLRGQQREAVADAVNASILAAATQAGGSSSTAHIAAPVTSNLERLLQHLAALQDGLYEENGDQGEIFQLDRCISLC